MVLVGAVLYYFFGRELSSMTMTLVVVAVLMVWACFFMPTRCDYQTQRYTPCTRWVRGKLRGCRTHGRLKRDAVFAAIRLRNPGLLFRVMWSAPGTAIPGSIETTSGGGVSQSRSFLPSKQAAYDVAMLVLTMVSTLSLSG
jgi:hypothetical protein